MTSVYGVMLVAYSIDQDGEPLSSENQLSLMRKMLEVGCEPSSVGSMAGAAAPADPIFYMLHGLMEKAYHVLRLSPSYNEKYNFEWQDYTCGEGISGAALHESLPFTGDMQNVSGLRAPVILRFLGAAPDIYATIIGEGAGKRSYLSPSSPLSPHKIA